MEQIDELPVESGGEERLNTEKARAPSVNQNISLFVLFANPMNYITVTDNDEEQKEGSYIFRDRLHLINEKTNFRPSILL